MAIDGKKLINYLAHGIPHSQIATALGITPGRVTQLAEEERVISAVAIRKEEIAAEGMTELAELNGIKKNLVSRISELANYTESLSEAVNAYEKLEKITSTKMGQSSEESGVKTIILQAPIFIQNALPSEVVLDSRNRIASIKGRSMAQMPTQGVLKILRGEKDDAETTNQGSQPAQQNSGAVQV